MANAIGLSGGKIVKIKNGVNLDVGAGALLVDNISESTSASGITIDGVKLKDNAIVIGNGSTIGSVGTAGAITIDSSGNVSLSANLTVNGVTETVNQTNLDVSDNIIGLNRGATTNANDSGLIIERGSTGDNAAILWDESADKFIVGTTTATPSDTGDLTVTTGTLVANIEGNLTGNVTGNASGTAGSLATAQNFSITGDVSASAVSFNGTGAVTLSSVLATVNNNTGQFGSSSAVPVITVNGKGLVTAVSTASISTSFDISDGSTTDTVAGGETLTFSGTANQIDTVVSSNEVAISIPDSPTFGAGNSGDAVTINADLEVNDGFNIVNKIPMASGQTVSTGDFVTVTLTKATGNGSMIIGMHVGGANSGTAELAVNGTTVKGFDFSSGYAAGDQLFLQTDGTMTKTAPTTGEIIQVGYALTAANPGQMYVDVKHIMSN